MMTFQAISQSINDMLTNLLASSVILVPRIFWAVVVAGIGLLIAWVLKKMILHIVHIVDQLLERLSVQKGIRYVHIRQPLEKFIGEAVFWIALIFFLVLAVQILQLPILSTFLKNLMNSLPTLVLGILIVLASFSIGSIARQIVSTAFQAMEIEQADIFGTGIKVLIVVIGILLGVAQIGIDINLLMTVVSISFAAFLGAIGLAFGLGAQSYVANLLSSTQLRKIYQPGDVIMIDGMKGKIIEISSTMVILQSEEGQITMPTVMFFEKQSYLLDQESKDAS